MPHGSSSDWGSSARRRDAHETSSSSTPATWPCSKRAWPNDGRGSGGHAGEFRDDVVAVGPERLLLALRHQVDVELADAHRLELAQLLARLLGGAEDAEAVADLVRDELAVPGADAAVLVVVVELPRLDEVGQGLRDDVALGPVALDQVHDVVRDHRREPAHLLARVGEVARDVARGADDALQSVRVASLLRGRAARRLH